MENYIVPCLLAALTPIGALALVLSYKLAQRAMNQTESMQRDHTMIVSELMASNTVKETNDKYTAGQILGHSNAHDIRKHKPPIPDSFLPDANDTLGLHQSPDVIYGEGFEDDMSPPAPGEET